MKNKHLSQCERTQRRNRQVLGAHENRIACDGSFSRMEKDVYVFSAAVFSRLCDPAGQSVQKTTPPRAKKKLWPLAPLVQEVS